MTNTTSNVGVPMNPGENLEHASYEKNDRQQGHLEKVEGGPNPSSNSSDSVQTAAQEDLWRPTLLRGGRHNHLQSPGQLGLAGRLFKALIQLLSSLSKEDQTTDTASKKNLRAYRDECERFLLWGEGFGAGNGDLDIILSRSTEIRVNVLSLLFQIGTVIIQNLFKTINPPEPAELLQAQFINLQGLLESTNAIIAEERKGLRYSDAFSESEASEGGLSDAVDDISGYIDCLMDLAPALENPAIDLDYEEDAISRLNAPGTQLNQEIYREVEKPKEERQRMLNNSSRKNDDLDQSRNEIKPSSSPTQGKVRKDSVDGTSTFNQTTEIMTIRKDEYDIDFEDTRAFVVNRYNEILESLNDGFFSQADRRTIMKSRDWQTIQAEIQRKRQEPNINAQCKRLLNHLQPLPQTLNNLTQFFQHAVDPIELKFEPLWGLVYLNIKLSSVSVEKLRRTTEWIARLRRVLELFNRCIESCNEHENNETRIAIIDVFDPLLFAFANSVKFLRNYENDQDVVRGWPAFDAKINSHISEIDGICKHLNSITKYSAANRERSQKNSTLRHGAVRELEELAAFPIKMLPYRKNPRFYGRTMELQTLNQALDWKIPGAKPLRTYNIYGRRGVGKTELALEYAFSNPAGFDAIFWVECETSLILRQTFTDMALRLNLLGADKHGHHEENQLNVLNWLKLTKARWLMIFNNAENENLLKGYWPMGATGAILIISRNYYNFMMYEDRKGDSVKPFDYRQSFDLLFQFLGDNGRELQKKRPLKPSEVNAANEFLGRLEGLPLAIQQAAVLIRNGEIGDATIEATLGLFKERSRALLERQTNKRSETYHPLDTLLDMNFRLLHSDAWQLLGVLSLLSPDMTCIELFLPRRQAVLNGKLMFCKQKQNLVDDEHITLAKILTPTRALEDALVALVKAELIKREGREIHIHRVVQEAVNYHSAQDLQESFDAAVRIVAEAFPKRQHGNTLFEQWATCSMYIHDAVHLVRKFSEYSSLPIITPRLEGTDGFIEMIGNCAWYLCEVSAYDSALDIIDRGYNACRDKESLPYADLCNTAGVCYLEKNFLNDCRLVLETSLCIREAKLPADDIEIATSTCNMGNLETAVGNYDKAIEYFDRAVKICIAQGDTAANQLALLYLCIGRVHSLRKNYDKAVKTLSMAERLFVRTLGAERHYMAHIHYAYGNVENQNLNWLAARRCYQEALRIAISETPLNPITAAAYFRLGYVEYKLKHDEIAQTQLEKARCIAEFRSPTRDDGTIARILWMQSRVLANNVLSAAQSEQLRIRAEMARKTLMGQNESASLYTYDADRNQSPEDEYSFYDALVPVFFR